MSKTATMVEPATDREFDAEEFLATLTRRPGVYRMIDADGEVIYVGKARNLKSRVASYFGRTAHHPKTQALMNHTTRVEVTVTGSEHEALLLEYNLIKAHRPRFNVLLRDDKSYPYIHVSTEQTFPRFEFHRGSRRGKGRYLGPYPGAGSVRQTLGQVQKLFRVRQCTDSFFSNRERPCLQYQIRRCSGPCVGLVEPEEYGRDVANAIRFIQGRNDAVLDDLVQRMEAASAAREFEQAARYRDQIAAIKSVQARQAIAGGAKLDIDAVAVHTERGVNGVAVIMARGGRVLGSRHFFPAAAAGTEPDEVLSAFLVQHYFRQAPPAEIIVSEPVADAVLLAEVLSERSGHRVAIRGRVRSQRRRWLEMARSNARDAVQSRLSAKSSLRRQFDSLAALLDLDEAPSRIECFDISHTGGDETMAACVVFGAEGALKSDYRRFRIRTAAPGDDYAAIGEAVERRYTRVRKGEAPLPQVLLIDGGRGQVAAARERLEKLQLEEIELVGVAKGAGRRPGLEKLYRPGAPDPLRPPASSPAMHLVQQLRDEAHRFALSGHRQRRGKARRTSTLESIPGLGPARRRALLREFGGLQGVRRAGIDDLRKVQGISGVLAERIFETLHGGATRPGN